MRNDDGILDEANSINFSANEEAYEEASSPDQSPATPTKKGVGFSGFEGKYPIGTFVISNKTKEGGKAETMMQARIVNENTPRVGGELKENANIRSRALEIVELTETARAFIAAGFRVYNNANGETVFQIPDGYKDSIAERATEGLKIKLSKHYLERFTQLSQPIARLATLEARAVTVNLTVKKDSATIKQLLEGVKKIEDPSEFAEALSLIESNLDDIEEAVVAKEKEKKEGEALAAQEYKKIKTDLTEKEKEVAEADTRAKLAEEVAARHIQEEEARLRNDKEAAERAANARAEEIERERTENLHLLHEFTILLSNFLRAESLSRGLMITLDDSVAEETLATSAQELNTLKDSFAEKPSQKILDTFKVKTEAYTALITTLEKKQPEPKPTQKEERSDDTKNEFGIMSGWPKSLDGSDFKNSALLADYATKYDEAFDRYEAFFSGDESATKITTYSHLIDAKNAVNAALRNKETESLAPENKQNLFVLWGDALTEAEKAWEAVLAAREEEKRIKAEQVKLLEKLTTLNTKLEKVNSLRDGLLPYRGTEEQQSALKHAYETIAEKQQVAKHLVETGEPITDKAVNEYRDSLDTVTGLLAALEKDKVAFEAEQKLLQEKLTSLFHKGDTDFARVTNDLEAISSDISSGPESAMVKNGFLAVKKEHDTLLEKITENQSLTEKEVKAYLKRLQDFDGGMLSAVKNRIYAAQHATKETKPHNIHQLGADGKIIKEDVRLSSEASVAHEALPYQLQNDSHEYAYLKEEYAKWATRDRAKFLRYWLETLAGRNTDDRERKAAEPIVEEHLQGLTDKKRDLEERIEQLKKQQAEANSGTAKTQIGVLQGEVQELVNEINYLSPKNTETKTSDGIFLFKGRLKTTPTVVPKGIAGEIRPSGSSTLSQPTQMVTEQTSEQKPIQTESGESKETPSLREEMVSKELQIPIMETTTVEEVPEPSIAQEIIPETSSKQEGTVDPTQRQNAVTKLLETLRVPSNSNDLRRILSPLPGSVTKRTPERAANDTTFAKTIAETASIEDFLTKEELVFKNEFATQKIGFKNIITTYATSVHIDPKNPASLATISTMNVHTLLHGEEGVYGLDETKRAELSHVVAMLDTILRATESHKKLSHTILGEPLSTVKEGESFEAYFARVLREVEQTELTQAASKARALQSSLYKKAA